MCNHVMIVNIDGLFEECSFQTEQSSSKQSVVTLIFQTLSRPEVTRFKKMILNPHSYTANVFLFYDDQMKNSLCIIDIQKYDHNNHVNKKDRYGRLF